MINELKELVKNSSEDEVKSLLFQILLRINMVKETKYSEGKFTNDLKKIYTDFLNYKSAKTINENEKDYEVVHIIFGDSPSGSLKMVLRDMELQNKEKVISFSDLFSIGPVWRLHEEIGLTKRYEWLKNHINFDEEFMDKYQVDFNNTTININAIPQNVPIIIWVGNNSHEQTALRYVLYLLRAKINNIILINTTTNYKNQFHIPEIEYFPLHTGEITPEKLRLIYEKNRTAQPLSKEERKKFEEDWEALSTKQEVLRIWENKELYSVNEDYYDDYIINTTRNLHNEQKSKGFMKSARVIGQVVGHLNQYIGDLYVEYRVRHLIMDGVFEIQGIPKAMRFYSVQLR
ncbi:DUF1835 domain-containing protein [Siminovitchia fordii]|uniref:DUF1835 domain-containing protein n=1 Tax=Siminovitchia fordii TaxID=254759 RepID=A0ABQ4KEX4_9BACI|nr:DUF1835 domain-containing protein [Siminovitchia fordii]GIN23413.1 hypothetical protein J1TS3_45470 [Siminovitchia fordii]